MRLNSFFVFFLSFLSVFASAQTPVGNPLDVPPLFVNGTSRMPRCTSLLLCSVKRTGAYEDILCYRVEVSLSVADSTQQMRGATLDAGKFRCVFREGVRRVSLRFGWDGKRCYTDFCSHQSKPFTITIYSRGKPRYAPFKTVLNNGAYPGED